MFNLLSRSRRSFPRQRRRPAPPALRVEQLEDRINPSTGWALGFAETIMDVAADNFGNVYATGSFQGTADFDPGPGVANLTGAGGIDSFVAKYAADGSFLWARPMGGTGSDSGTAIEVVGDRVYVSGFFMNSVGFGSTTLTSMGDRDAYVCQLDANGTFSWAVRSGGDWAWSLAVDPAGNVLTTGYFSGTADFDLGPGTNPLTALGGKDVFISKLDQNGNFVWARRAGSNGGEDLGYAIDTDRLGNVYVSGQVGAPADFGSFTIGGTFVTKLDAGGTFLWATARGELDDGQAQNGLAVDDRDADPANWALYRANYSHGIVLPRGITVSKLQASNGAGVWDQVFASSTYGNQTGEFYFSTLPKGLALSPTGDVYVTGWVGASRNATDFDPGPGTAYLSSASANPSDSWDGFLVRLDGNGNYVAARVMGSANPDESRGLTVGSDGTVYFGGTFNYPGSGPATFDTGDATVSLNASARSGFLVKRVPTCSTISGRVIRDANGNGQDDDGFGLHGWTVYLDQNGNSQLDTGEPTAVTDRRGVYTFAHLPAGTYSVAQVPRAGWTLTTPSSATVTLSDGRFHHQTFGNTVATTVRTYSSPNVPRSTAGTTSTLTITDNFNILDLNVRVSVTHTKVQELRISLVGPDGQRVRLLAFTSTGQKGKNLTNTVFDQDAALRIGQGNAPYTGNFRPADTNAGLSPAAPSLNWWDGQLAAGTWTLELEDNASATTGTLTSWALQITTATGSPLQVAGPSRAGRAPATLTADALQPIVQEAIARFQAAGLDAASIARLQSTSIQIGDLGPGMLAMQDSSGIWIDDDAAGRGWFVDPTPSGDQEFRKRGNQGEKHRIDLLNTVMHDLGHVLGLDHDESGVMQDTLAPGTRWVPTRDILDGYFAALAVAHEP